MGKKDDTNKDDSGHPSMKSVGAMESNAGTTGRGSNIFVGAMEKLALGKMTSAPRLSSTKLVVIPTSSQSQCHCQRCKGGASKESAAFWTS
jgi:hypothetical protein